MPKVDRAERNANIATDAEANGWSYEQRGEVDLTAYRGFMAFRGVDRLLAVKNLVRGALAGMEFAYYEYTTTTAVGTERWSVCSFKAPFNSPGLRFAAPEGHVRAHCREPGFVDAVLDAPVRDVLSENPFLAGEWNGDRLVLRVEGRPEDWNDFRGVSEAVAALMTRIPEMEFEAVEPASAYAPVSVAPVSPLTAVVPRD